MSFQMTAWGFVFSFSFPLRVVLQKVNAVSPEISQSTGALECPYGLVREEQAKLQPSQRQPQVQILVIIFKTAFSTGLHKGRGVSQRIRFWYIIKFQNVHGKWNDVHLKSVQFFFFIILVDFSLIVWRPLICIISKTSVSTLSFNFTFHDLFEVIPLEIYSQLLYTCSTVL